MGICLGRAERKRVLPSRPDTPCAFDKKLPVTVCALNNRPDSPVGPLAAPLSIVTEGSEAEPNNGLTQPDSSQPLRITVSPARDTHDDKGDTNTFLPNFICDSPPSRTLQDISPHSSIRYLQQEGRAWSPPASPLSARLALGALGVLDASPLARQLVQRFQKNLLRQSAKVSSQRPMGSFVALCTGRNLDCPLIESHLKACGVSPTGAVTYSRWLRTLLPLVSTQTHGHVAEWAFVVLDTKKLRVVSSRTLWYVSHVCTTDGSLNCSPAHVAVPETGQHNAFLTAKEWSRSCATSYYFFEGVLQLRRALRIASAGDEESWNF